MPTQTFPRGRVARTFLSASLRDIPFPRFPCRRGTWRPGSPLHPQTGMSAPPADSNARHKHAVRIGLTLFAAMALAGRNARAAESAWVHPGPDGKLLYQTTSSGDRIMDFSHAGYRGGGFALPNVPVTHTLKPSGNGDDTAAIQRAINAVAALKPENGFRGAVLLAPGVFSCSNTITISSSGVVLRGSGSTGETTRTTIRLTGQPHNAITIRASPGRRDAEPAPIFASAQTTMADAYVPSGTARFAVSDATGFAVGDTIERSEE